MLFGLTLLCLISGGSWRDPEKKYLFGSENSKPNNKSKFYNAKQ